MRCETFDLSGDGRVTLKCYIHHWTTTAGHYPLRGGVLVLPGGAYVMHGASEGEPVALAFFAQGYNAYVLRYSVGKHAVFPNSAADAARALALIRQHGAEWYQAADKLAVCGFSAGGHVAACLGTMWDRADVQAASGISDRTGRPDALILGYPCICADAAGQGDMLTLLAGDRPLEEMETIASADLAVGPQTPPVFLWNIFGDQLVPVEHGLRFLTALAAHEIPFEAHTYQSGVHGSALATPVTSIGAQIRENSHVARWFTDCCLWLSELFGAPELDCAQFDLYFPGQGRAQMGVPSIPAGLFESAGGNG